MERLLRHDGESRDTDRPTWSHRHRELWRAGRPPRGGVRRACGEPPGCNRRERSHEMNRSAEVGEWSSPHYGGEGAWFHPGAPRCLRATRRGRNVCDPGRPGIVRRRAKKVGLAVGVDISDSEIPADAVPGVGSGRGTLERSQNKRLRIAVLNSGAGVAQKGRQRGKAPYFAENVRRSRAGE